LGEPGVIGGGAGEGLGSDVRGDPIQGLGDGAGNGGERVGVAANRTRGPNGLLKTSALGRQGDAFWHAPLAGFIIRMMLPDEGQGRQVGVKALGGLADGGGVAGLTSHPNT